MANIKLSERKLSELLNHYLNLDTFIIKVLMWGYPTKGRGKNIETLMIEKNFKKLIEVLEQLRLSETISQDDINKIKIPGLGWSTLSKFLYFLQLKVGENRALIFDRRVINALGKFEDEELVDLQRIKYPPKTKDYLAFIDAIGRLSGRMKVNPDNIEMFMYQFGANLSEPKGEDGVM